MVDIQSATDEIRQGRKEEERRRKKKPQDKNIMSASAIQGGHNKPFVYTMYQEKLTMNELQNHIM